MRVTGKILEISRTKKLRLTSDLQQSWRIERRSAASGRRGRENSERLRRERKNRADLIEGGRQRSGTGQNGVRRMSQRMKCASAMAGMAERAFRLLHLGSHGVQVVSGRDHGEQQHECAAESAEEDQRAHRRTSCRTPRTGRRSPSLPQQISWQQQGEPAEIKKKLHTKCPGPVEEIPRPGKTVSR